MYTFATLLGQTQVSVYHCETLEYFPEDHLLPLRPSIHEVFISRVNK